MANKTENMSMRQIQTKLNQLTTLIPALRDDKQPVGQLWSDIWQEFQQLSHKLELQEALPDQRIEQVMAAPITSEAEYEQLLAETVVLFRGSQAIAGAFSERQIFETLFEQIRLQNPCEIAAFRFHLVNDEPIWAELIASWHKQNSPTYPDKTRLFLPDNAQIRLLTSARPIFIDDITTDSRLTAAERASFEPTLARSVALLPLAATGYQFGIVLVYFTSPYTFTEMVQRLWLALMDQVSISLLNLEFIQKSAYRAIQMDTAAEVARVASSILELPELLNTTVNLMRDRFELYYVGVFMVDETGEWAMLRAGTGEEGRIQLERGHRLKIGGESMIGWAVANRQARIALDVGKEAVHFQNPVLPLTRSEMALPLIHRGEVIGALTIQSVEQAAFSREDIIFFRTMADQLAVAIDNAQLFSQVQQSEATNRALLDAIPDLMFRISRTGTYLDVRGSAEVTTVIPHEEFVGKTLFDVLPPEVAQERLRYIEKTLATGELQTFEYDLTIAGQRHYFEARLVASGQDEVLTIIRDITERRESERVQEAIYRISEAAHSASTLQELFGTIHNIVCDLTHTDNFYIALYDDTTDLLDFTYFIDQYDDLSDRRSGKGLTAYVLKTGQPLLATPQVYADLINRGDVEPLGPPSVDWLGVPLKIGHKIIGVLAVQSYSEAIRLSEKHKDILSFVSAQVAMAIERKRAEEAVQVSENKYRELVENANSIIFRMNTRGEVTFFNEFAQRFFDYKEEEIMGRHVVGTIVPQTDTSGQNLAAMIKDIIAYPDLYATNENENIRRNGERVWVAWTNKAILDETGQVTGILCVGNDITERKRAEASLQEALRRSQLLYNISEALAAMTDRQAVLETVLGEYLLLLKLDRGRVTMFDPSSGSNKVQAMYLDHRVVKPDYAIPSAEDSIADYLAKNPFPLLIENVPSHPLTKAARQFQEAVQTVLFIPLISRGEVIGTMSAEAIDPNHRFSQDDIEAGKSIADQLAIWLENRQLFEQAQHRSNLLATGAEISGAASSILDPDELINTSVNLICNRFGFYYVGLFLVDETKKWAVLRAGAGEAGRLQVEKGHRLQIGGESMIGWAVANRQARIALDVGKDAVHFQNPFLPDTRSEMALPLTSRDEVIGALTVQSAVQNAFSKEDITVLQTMADQLGNAIANARLFDHVRRSQQAAEALLQETQALQQLSQALAGTLDTDEILDLFFRACTQDIGFEYVMLSLVDQARHEVKAIAGVGVSAGQIKRARHPLHSNDIMADIVRTGATEVLTGWDQRFDQALYEDEGHADWIRLFTPIVLRRENVGLVEAGFNKTRRSQIDDAQIRLLRAFIDQTALALDNAHRYQASQRTARREALIKEITTKVRASTDLEKILQTTVKEVGDALGSKRAYVQLVSEVNGESKTDQ